jgi:hypothetical protein
MCDGVQYSTLYRSLCVSKNQPSVKIGIEKTTSPIPITFLHILSFSIVDGLHRMQIFKISFFPGVKFSMRVTVNYLWDDKAETHLYIYDMSKGVWIHCQKKSSYSILRNFGEDQKFIYGKV